MTRAIDVKGVTDALVIRLDQIDGAGKTILVERTLPQIFGLRISLTMREHIELDLPTLEHPVTLAYRTVRVEDGRDRMNQGVYLSDERDDTQDTCSTVFGLLAKKPGRITVNALLRLIKIPDFPISAAQLRALAL